MALAWGGRRENGAREGVEGKIRDVVSIWKYRTDVANGADLWMRKNHVERQLSLCVWSSVLEAGGWVLQLCMDIKGLDLL